MTRSLLIALIALTAMVAAPDLALAQGETTTLVNGWSVTTRLRRLSDVNAVACGADHAVARSWGGGVARWDGVAWSELPELPGSQQGHTYGRHVAIGADGRIAVEASGRIATWNGSAWSVAELTGWPQYTSVGGLAVIGADVYAVGRGRIARSDGAVIRSYDAGTWRDLAAIGGVGPSDLWTAGQGGTLLHWDGSTWSRATSGTENFLGGLLVVSANDVWAWTGTDAAYRTLSLLHYDGHAWSSVAPPSGNQIVGVAARGTRVWVATDEGVFERAASAWQPALVPADFGDTNHTILALCATESHLVVGAGLGSVLTRSIR